MGVFLYICGMLVRNCPSCGFILTYKCIGNLNNANKKNSDCKKCTEAKKHGRNIITDNAIFFRLYSKERKTVKEIADYFGVLESTVKNYANDNKINRRDYDVVMESEGKKRCHGCNDFYIFDNFHKTK